MLSFNRFPGNIQNALNKNVTIKQNDFRNNNSTFINKFI